MLLRYCILTVLVCLSLYAVLITGTTTSQAILAQSAGAGPVPNYGLYALVGIAAFSALSLFRFVLHGFPSLLVNWYVDHRDWLSMAVLGVLVIVIFYWL